MSLLHTLSDVALRTLPEPVVRTLRDRYLGARRRLGPVERLVYGHFDAAALREHLHARVGTDYEILMVHSSMNALTHTFDGTPLDIVRMLIEFCGPERTLAMPAFFFGDPEVGSVHQTFERNPLCVLRHTPSQMGLATELFRRTKGVVQSRHPVYRIAALGPLAEDLVRGHEHCIGAASRGSPFDFMAERDTMVVGIGKSFHVMTQVHFVEGCMGDEFPMPRTPRNGFTEVTVRDRGEDVLVRIPRGGGIDARYNVAKLPSLVPRSELDYWKFHNVPMFAGRAGPVTRRLIAAAREGRTLYDPH